MSTGTVGCAGAMLDAAVGQADELGTGAETDMAGCIRCTRASSSVGAVRSVR